MAGLYIHIPYCAKKCIYCDFFSGGARSADWKRLTDALIAELTERIDEIDTEIETVYYGGGTPSLMPPEDFARLAEAIGRFAPNPIETTIEVNPDDVNEEKIATWKREGVNRVSMGVQSLNDSELASIGRRHDRATALAAYHLLSRELDNVSIDLMFGLPGQTLDTWRETVEESISLCPHHISAYSLMYEPGTALTALRDSGRIKECDEQLSLDMFGLLSSLLREVGYEQYEISNYSRPGYRSRHNSSYWTGVPYLGIGPSAHSHDGQSIRRANPARLREYLDRFAPLSPVYEIKSHKKTPYYIEEDLTQEELREERIMLRLRTREGIDLDTFEREFGKEQRELLMRDARQWIERGKVCLRDDRYLALTKAGVMQSDAIILSLA